MKRIPFDAETAQGLIELYGSPLYVYDAQTLIESAKTISGAVSYPHTRFFFAAVTNGNIHLLAILRKLGWGLHANTPGDIFLALKAGFTPEQIVYSGSNLTQEEMCEIVEQRISTVNLDSVSQLRLLTIALENTDWRPRVGLRVNIPQLNRASRIGVRPDEFNKAIEIARTASLRIEGIHFYRGTGTNSTEAFTGAIDELIAAALRLPDWSFLDFGGGFGYSYHANRTVFVWEEFGQELTRKLQELPKSIDLLIEPGRAVIAPAGILLTRVVSVKYREGKQIVGVDTTVSNLSVPAVHGIYREVYTFSDRQLTYNTDICGNTTFSRDYLGRDLKLPALEEGDLIAILDSGAYGYAMSSHFLHRPRPAEVLIENGAARLIRRREDYMALLSNQMPL